MKIRHMHDKIYSTGIPGLNVAFSYQKGTPPDRLRYSELLEIKGNLESLDMVVHAARDGEALEQYDLNPESD